MGNTATEPYRPPLSVLVHPHIDEANPYLQLVARELEAENVCSLPFSWRRLLTSRPDVLHVHWPELAVGPRKAWKALVTTVLFVTAVSVARLRGVAVVWTVHNLGSHERWHPRLEARLLQWWVNRVDGALSLSRWARKEAMRRYPMLRDVPFRTMPHGHYPTAIRVGKEQARTQLGLRPQERVALHFGHLRPYKGTDDLVRHFARSSLDVHLFVVGRARPPDYADLLRELASNDERIHLLLEQVEDEHLQRLIAAAEVVVLPYRRVTHSGSVLLALSAARPTVTTRRGAIPELQREVGDDWVVLLDDDWDACALEQTIKRALRSKAPQLPDLRGQGWDAVRRETRALYDEALSSSSCR